MCRHLLSIPRSLRADLLQPGKSRSNWLNLLTIGYRLAIVLRIFYFRGSNGRLPPLTVTEYFAPDCLGKQPGGEGAKTPSRLYSMEFEVTIIGAAKLTYPHLFDEKSRTACK